MTILPVFSILLISVLVLTLYVLTNFVKSNTFLIYGVRIFQLFINRLSSKGGSARKACVWLRRDGCREGQLHSCFCELGFSFFFVFMQQKFHCHSVVVFFFGLLVTFGGMCCWRRVAVARVFALVVRCRVMIVISLFSRWQKP